LILLARLPFEVLEHNVGDRKGRGVKETKSEVRLPIALVYFNGVVDVVDNHAIVGYVLYVSIAATTLEITGQCAGSVGPDFDAGTILKTSGQSVSCLSGGYIGGRRSTRGNVG
jgi:hypothetical protein